MYTLLKVDPLGYWYVCMYVCMFDNLNNANKTFKLMYECMYVCRRVADVVKESQLHRGLLEHHHSGRAELQAAQHYVFHPRPHEDVSLIILILFYAFICIHTYIHTNCSRPIKVLNLLELHSFKYTYIEYIQVLKYNLYIHTYIHTYKYRNNVRFVELIAALKILDMPEQSVYDKLKMVCVCTVCVHAYIYIHTYIHISVQ